MLNTKMKQEEQQHHPEYFTDLGRSKLQLLLVTVLVYILIWGTIDVLAEIFEGWNWRFLPAVVGFVALESAWTTRWIKRTPLRVNKSLYRLAEITVILILTGITYLVSHENQVRRDIIDAVLTSPVSVLNSSLVLWLALCFLAWRWSSVLTGIFNELVLSNDEVIYFTTPSAERQQKGIPHVVPVYRRRLFRSYIRNWVTGGVFLAGLAMLATIELSSSNLVTIQSLEFRNVTRLGLPSDYLVALVAYFMSGFWLAGHARMAVMQARWIAGGRKIETAVIHRWRRQVILIIALVSISTAFLPIGSSLAISRIIRALLNYLVAIFALIFAIIPIAIGWVLSFLPDSEPPLEVEPLPQLEPTLPQLQVNTPNFEFPPFILDAIFLTTAITVAILAFIYFFKFRYQSFDLTYLAGLWHSFIILVKDTWLSLSSGSRRMVESVKEIARLPRSLDVIPRKLPLTLPVRARTPTQRVRGSYLWLVKHVEREGVSRPESDTPWEYERLVVKSWPNIASDFRDLTRLFVEARYNIQPLTDAEARQAESIIKHLRGQIRRHLREKTSPGD